MRVPFDDEDRVRAEPFEPGADRPAMGGSTNVGDVSWVVPAVRCTTAVAALGTPAHS